MNFSQKYLMHGYGKLNPSDIPLADFFYGTMEGEPGIASRVIERFEPKGGIDTYLFSFDRTRRALFAAANRVIDEKIGYREFVQNLVESCRDLPPAPKKGSKADLRKSLARLLGVREM